MQNFSTRNARPRGFTLVEILVVIAIIGILAGLGIPAAMRAIGTANDTASKMEIESLAQAIEQYNNKYGDYPPDFSDWNVVQKHYKKIFPRIAPGELLLLQKLCDDIPANDYDTSVTVAGTHNPAAVDRAEALVWALMGFSDNIQLPFTGTGGPIQVINAGGSTIYQINVDRPNRLFDFADDKLSYNSDGFDPSAAVSTTNRYLSNDDQSGIGDLFLTYRPNGDGAPLVFFDSRTYDYFNATAPTGLRFNGYAHPDHGGVRPYYSDVASVNTSGANYPNPKAAMRAWKFMKSDTFQIIAAGQDGRFGSFVADASGNPVFFQYPTGIAIGPASVSANTPGGLVVGASKGYQESSLGSDLENNQADNITNFADGQLVNDAT